MRVGAFERSSIGEGFYFLSCGHTTHRKFFRSAWTQKMEQNPAYEQVLRSLLTDEET